MSSAYVHKFLCGGVLFAVPQHKECLEIYINYLSDTDGLSEKTCINAASCLNYRRLVWSGTQNEGRHSFGPWYGPAPYMQSSKTIYISDDVMIGFLRQYLHRDHRCEFGI